MEIHPATKDLAFLRQAIGLAEDAERNGNLPIGAVVSLDGEIIAEGKNAIWVPAFSPNRHAEIEALRAVPQDLWKRARHMTLYTTLEPCLMCAGAILLHHVGRIIFGSSDDYGGAGCVMDHLPPYFADQLAAVQWIGPALPSECDPLSQRVLSLVLARRASSSYPE